MKQCNLPHVPIIIGYKAGCPTFYPGHVPGCPTYVRMHAMSVCMHVMQHACFLQPAAACMQPCPRITATTPQPASHAQAHAGN